MHSLPRNLCAVMAALLLASCGSQAPRRAQPGTPEFNWLAAKDAFRKGDMERANQLLSSLATKENPYQAQAQPAALALSHGLAHAYGTLAEKYAAGAKKARTGADMLYGLVNDYRGRATAAGMTYAEIAQRFIPTAGESVVMAVPLPSGPTMAPQQFRKIEMGLAMQRADVVAVERHVVMMEIARSFQRSMGALNEPEKARALYQGDEAKVPAATYMLALGEGLYETSEMFGPKKLNQPNRVTAVLLDESLKALGKVPGDKEAGKLTKKAKDAQKALKVT